MRRRARWRRSASRALRWSDQVAALRTQIDGMKVAAADDAGARRALDQRIAALSADLAAATGENGQLSQTIRGMQRTVALIADDRSALRAARNELNAQVAFLEGRMTSMQATQQTIVQNLTDRARMTVVQIEKTIIMTGLDIDGLLDSAAAKVTGEGGPFVPVSRALRSTEERTMLASIQKLDGEVGRWEQLQLILRNLPLSAPLDNYQLMSGFGERLDPFTGQRASTMGSISRTRSARRSWRRRPEQLFTPAGCGTMVGSSRSTMASASTPAMRTSRRSR